MFKLQKHDFCWNGSLTCISERLFSVFLRYPPHYFLLFFFLQALLSALQDASLVFHCASPAPGSDDRQLFERVNVVGTQTVIQACLEAGVQVTKVSRGLWFMFGSRRWSDYAFVTARNWFWPAVPVWCTKGRTLRMERRICRTPRSLLTITHRPKLSRRRWGFLWKKKVVANINYYNENSQFKKIKAK